jgi:6-phosphofructokinase 2
VLPGSALHKAEWEACLDKLASLPDKPKIVVASGSIPPGVPEDFFARVARQAKAFGAKMVLDTSGPALNVALKEGVTLIKPNLGELSEFVGHPLTRDQDRIAACRKLVSDKRAEAVALTLGEDGALLVTADGAWRAAPLRVEVVSAVGAGDSFLGGMVAALAEGERIEHAFKLAVAAGVAAVINPGTELCREEDVRRLLADVRVSEVANAPA